jgi:hypothetical protein
MSRPGRPDAGPIAGMLSARQAPVAAVVWQLGKVETRRLIRHPGVLVGAALSLLTMVISTWNEAPVLHRDSIGASGALLILAGGALLAANGAVLRPNRFELEEHFGALPTPTSARTLAHVWSMLAPVGLGILVLVSYLLFLTAAGSVGRPPLPELLVGPAVIALGVALGVALARWAPAPGVAPLVVVSIAVVLVGLPLLGASSSADGPSRWLLPFVGLYGEPPELQHRPSGWHLAYLGGLVTAAAVVALLRDPPTRRTLAVAGLTMLLLTTTAAAQLRESSAAERASNLTPYVGAGRVEHCERLDGVSYCAFPTYRSWIARWATAVRPVVAQLPPAGRSSLPTVRQHVPVDPTLEPTPRPWDVRTDLSWGRRGGEPPFRQSLTIDFAVAAVGLPPRGTLIKAPPGGRPGGAIDPATGVAGICSAVGQARSVVALWLAGQADPALAADLPSRLGGAAMPWFGNQVVAYALQLLEQARDKVGRRIREHWRELTDPVTGSDRAVILLGLRPVQGSEFPHTLEPGAGDLPRCP